MENRSTVLALLLLCTLATPGQAQMAEPACPQVSDANLPADLKPWAGPRTPLVAASVPAPGLPSLPVGQPAAIALQPATTVRFARPPEQQRTPQDAHAGLVALTLPAAGVWRLSFSTPLWVDVLKGDAPLKSGAHGALAPCTSLRKVVEFDAAAGPYLVQLSGNPGRDVVMMVTKKP
jgi:hypothetical protein